MRELLETKPKTTKDGPTLVIAIEAFGKTITHADEVAEIANSILEALSGENTTLEKPNPINNPDVHAIPEVLLMENDYIMAYLSYIYAILNKTASLIR